MGRLWSSLLPVVGRGGGGAAEDAPVSVLLHMFEGQAVVVALCADLNLRLWSVQVGVVCTCGCGLCRWVWSVRGGGLWVWSVQVGVVWSVRLMWLVVSHVRLHEHQVPNPDSNLDHNPHGRGTWSKHNQSGSGPGLESPCKQGYSECCFLCVCDDPLPNLLECSWGNVC